MLTKTCDGVFSSAQRVRLMKKPPVISGLFDSNSPDRECCCDYASCESKAEGSK